MIGVDVVDINRFKQIKDEDFSNWEKVFTKDEWQYCFGKPKPYQSLSGIFALKEATMKAVGGDMLGRFDLIETAHSDSGKPDVILKTEKAYNIEASISHDAEIAVAIAMVIK